MNTNSKTFNEVAKLCLTHNSLQKSVLTKEEKRHNGNLACQKWYRNNQDYRKKYSEEYRKTAKGKAAVNKAIEKYEAKTGYGGGWNRVLKNKIRKRDNYSCQECGYTEKELGRKLDIHHIDYDKKNNSEDNLISLCKSCHVQTNFSREDWTKYYQGVVSR